jgi:hypothetical protein
MTGAPDFPLAATIAGVEVVTIPLSDYRDLLDCRRQLAELRVRADPKMRTARSPLDCDPELAAFLAERFGRMPVDRALDQCRARFGQARTPSRSAAFRFWDRLRGAKSSFKASSK